MGDIYDITSKSKKRESIPFIPFIHSSIQYKKE